MSSKMGTLKVTAFFLLFLSAISTPFFLTVQVQLTGYNQMCLTVLVAAWAAQGASLVCDQPFPLAHQRIKRKAGKGDPSPPPFASLLLPLEHRKRLFYRLQQFTKTVHLLFHWVPLGIIISIRSMNPLYIFICRDCGKCFVITKRRKSFLRLLSAGRMRNNFPLMSHYFF